MRKLRQVLLQFPIQTYIVEVAECLGNEDALGGGEIKYVAELVGTIDREQRIGDRAQSRSSKVNQQKFRPVRKLCGDDVSPADTHLRQVFRKDIYFVGDCAITPSSPTLIDDQNLIGRPR